MNRCVPGPSEPRLMGVFYAPTLDSTLWKQLDVTLIPAEDPRMILGNRSLSRLLVSDLRRQVVASPTCRLSQYSGFYTLSGPGFRYLSSQGMKESLA